MDLSSLDPPYRRAFVLRRRRFRTVLLVIGFLLLSIGVGVGIAYVLRPATDVPAVIKQQASFPLYVPDSLPGKYAVVRDSFMVQEKVVVFRATDGIDGSITFTQQAKPKDFNFEAFYKEQVKDPVTLNNVPYPSMRGKALSNDAKLLSIVTDTTWIMVSTQSPLDDEALQYIAQHIRRAR